MIRKTNKGAASILIIFMLGMIGVMIGVSLVKTGFDESIMGRSINQSAKAYYAANSGVEDAVRRLTDFPDTTLDDHWYTFNLDDTEYKYRITEGKKKIESIGTYEKYSRKIVVQIGNSLDFSKAIFAGGGGLDFTGVVIYDGDVYSKENIIGKASKCDDNNNGTTINGSATAVNMIKDVCIKEDAYATDLNRCFIGGNSYSVHTPTDCDYDNSKHHEIDATDPSLAPNDVPDIGVKKFISGFVIADPHPYPGNCVIGKKGSDCSNKGVLENRIINGNLTISADVTIKNIIINGDLTISADVTINGDVLVKGNIYINSNSIISISSVTSPMVIANGKNGNDGIINIASKVLINKSSDAKVFLLLVATYDEAIDVSCNTDKNHAIYANANIEAKQVLFYAQAGCVSIDPKGSSNISGAVYAESVSFGNAVLTYDPNLAESLSDISGGGDWQISSFKEY
jgi:hypothetical protein